MLIALIISVILCVICFMAFFASDSDLWGLAGVFFLSVAVIAFLGSINWQVSSQNLTGYIYSSSDKAGYTTAHIRFSENAGTDSQPEFCVKADSDPGRAIKQYVGSGKKVKVDIPSYFYFANNPFACGTTNMTIKEVK